MILLFMTFKLDKLNFGTEMIPANPYNTYKYCVNLGQSQTYTIESGLWDWGNNISCSIDYEDLVAIITLRSRYYLMMPSYVLLEDLKKKIPFTHSMLEILMLGSDQMVKLSFYYSIKEIK